MFVMCCCVLCVWCWCWLDPSLRRTPLRTTLRRTAQNFALFFSSPATISLFLSLWVSSRGILVVFSKAGTLKCARLEFSGCRRKNENCGGRGKKRAKFWAVRRRGVRRRGGGGVLAQGGPGESKPTTTTTTLTTTTPTPPEMEGPKEREGAKGRWGPEGWAPKGRAPSPAV